MGSMYNVADDMAGKLTAAQNAAASQGVPASTLPADGRANIQPIAPAPAATAAPAPSPAAGVPNAAPASYNPYNQTAPQTNPGILAGAMTPAPQVAAGTTADKVAQGSAANANTTNWNVTTPQTVQGQVAGIIDKDSPLMQRAATRADQQMNQRGLINSSMAVQAGQAALYDAAMPMAQQDAQTNAQAGQFNAGAANNTSQFNAQQGNAMTAANVAQRNDALKTDATMGLQAQLANADNAVKQSAQQYDSAVKIAMQNTDAAGKLQLQQVDSATRQSLAEIEARYKTQMQTSQSMASTYQQMLDGVTRIMQDPNLDGPSKQASINNLTQTMRNAMAVQEQITGLQLGSLLDFNTAVGGYKPGTPVANYNNPQTQGYDPNNMPGGQ